jgi:hypothetical protein
MIWLGAYLEAHTLRLTSGPLTDFFLGGGGQFGDAQMPENVHKGPQVSGMYVPMSKLENKPLTKSIGPII